MLRIPWAQAQLHTERGHLSNAATCREQPWTLCVSGPAAGPLGASPGEAESRPTSRGCQDSDDSGAQNACPTCHEADAACAAPLHPGPHGAPAFLAHKLPL